MRNTLSNRRLYECFMVKYRDIGDRDGVV